MEGGQDQAGPMPFVSRTHESVSCEGVWTRLMMSECTSIEVEAPHAHPPLLLFHTLANVPEQRSESVLVINSTGGKLTEAGS